MQLDRRQMIAAAGAGASFAAIAGPRVDAQAAPEAQQSAFVTDYGAVPDSSDNQTGVLQKAIDDAARTGRILHFPAGAYLAGGLTLPSGSNLTGVHNRSILKFSDDDSGITAKSVNGIRLAGLVLDGSDITRTPSGTSSALFQAEDVTGLSVTACRFSGGAGNCLSFIRCAGQISDNEISKAPRTGLFCNDSTRLTISHNHVHACGNNGIQIWRSKPGEDGTTVSFNRIEAIGASHGGSGQNGNGINVFRAGSVQVTGNRITDCVFSAIRGNAASNFLVTGNSCDRLGEVAIYAEFGFEGTVIANNIVDKAASGISVTNFNEGGRMAVIQGNLIRNLFLRDKQRGVGIAVEADAMVSGNVIEGAPGGGIMVGWGKYLRDVNVTGNLVREARIGIGVSASPGAGYAYVTNNMLSVTADGGIRAMDHDKLLGPDLAKTSSESYRNMAVFGNVSL